MHNCSNKYRRQMDRRTHRKIDVFILFMQQPGRDVHALISSVAINSLNYRFHPSNSRKILFRTLE